MTKSDRFDGLAELLLDAARAGQPDAELLARFALDPDSLSRAEHDEVEAFLERRPEQRTSIRALRSLKLSERLRGAPTSPPRAPAPTARRSRRTRSVVVGALAVLTAAAAVVLLLRTPPAPPSPGAREAHQVARAEPAPTPAPVQRPGPVPGEGAAGPVDSGTPPERLQPEPARPEAIAPERARIEADAGGGPTAAPGTSAGPRATPAPDRATPAPVVDPKGRDPEPVQLAMVMPTYVPGPRADRRRRVSAAQRSSGPSPTLVALAPAHVAESARAAPTLLWYVDALPDRGRPRFVLTREGADAAAPLVDVALKRPDHAGTQVLAVARWLSSVPEGDELRMSITWPLDPADPSDAVITSAWLRRVPLSPAVAAALEAAPPGARPDILARAGLWYDALAELSSLRAQHPDDDQVVLAARRLLDQAGLEDVPVP